MRKESGVVNNVEGVTRTWQVLLGIYKSRTPDWHTCKLWEKKNPKRLISDSDLPNPNFPIGKYQSISVEKFPWMMWNTIANLKENLNKIALDVHGDDDDELQIHTSVVAPEDPSVSDRRASHNYAHSNGIDSALKSEVICLNFASSRECNWKVPVRY